MKTRYLDMEVMVFWFGLPVVQIFCLRHVQEENMNSKSIIYRFREGL